MIKGENVEVADEEENLLKTEDIKLEEKILDDVKKEPNKPVPVETPDIVKTEQVAPPEQVDCSVVEKDEYKSELKFWGCVCLTLEEWTTFHNKLQASKKQVDIDLAAVIETNYLGEMPGLFQKYEKEKLQRLLAQAPKRQSERLRNWCEENGDGVGYGSEDVEGNEREGMEIIPLTEQEKEDEKVRKEKIARQREGTLDF